MHGLMHVCFVSHPSTNVIVARLLDIARILIMLNFTGHCKFLNVTARRTLCACMHGCDEGHARES